MYLTFCKDAPCVAGKNTISHSVVCERKGDVSHFECNSTFVVQRLVYMYLYIYT